MHFNYKGPRFSFEMTLYYCTHTLSSYFVRNVTQENLFIEQPNKLWDELSLHHTVSIKETEEDNSNNTKCKHTVSNGCCQP